MLDFKSASAWNNIKTGETDWLYETPENLADYLPQDDACQNMFKLLVETGQEPLDAFIRVLTAATGGAK